MHKREVSGDVLGRPTKGGMNHLSDPASSSRLRCSGGEARFISCPIEITSEMVEVLLLMVSWRKVGREKGHV